MNKRLKAGIYAGVFSLFTAFLPNEIIAKEPVKAFTSQMKTNYTTAELLDILKKEGFQAEALDEDIIAITVNGDKFMLNNSYKNGDIQLNDFYSTVNKIPFSKINAWNTETRYGKVYLMSDIKDTNTFALEYLLPAEAGLSAKQIIAGVKNFLMIQQNVEKYFMD